MKNLINQTNVLILVIITDVLAFICLLDVLNLVKLDSVQKLFSIVGSFSLIVALFTYFYKKKQDETLATIDQITFLRKEILPEWSKVREVIKTKNKTYWYCRIKPTKYTIECARGEFSKNFEQQLSAFFNKPSTDPANWSIDSSVMDQQVSLLNMLEEFSLKVQHFKTEKHPALSSVHGVFVELVENNMTAILFMREVVTGNSVYSTILFLYDLWKDNTEKTNLVNNLEKTGFITKDQLQTILKQQRTNRGS